MASYYISNDMIPTHRTYSDIFNDKECWFGRIQWRLRCAKTTKGRGEYQILYIVRANNNRSINWGFIHYQLLQIYYIYPEGNAQTKKRKLQETMVLQTQNHGESSFLIPDFCSAVSLVGNLMLNLILRLPLLVGSLGIGIPSLGTTSS